MLTALGGLPVQVSPKVHRTSRTLGTGQVKLGLVNVGIRDEGRRLQRGGIATHNSSSTIGQRSVVNSGVAIISAEAMRLETEAHRFMPTEVRTKEPLVPDVLSNGIRMREDRCKLKLVCHTKLLQQLELQQYQKLVLGREFRESMKKP